MKVLCLLGSTGSIGTSALDVVRRHPDRFRIGALVAGRNTEALADQIVQFRPQSAVVADQTALDRLAERLAEAGLPRSRWPELAWGPGGRVAAAIDSEIGFVLSAIVGVSGLEATYEAIRAGKAVGLANKETLVAAGALVTEAARGAGVELIPVDSEHNGVHQCLRAGRRSEVRRVILTASGGPFRNTPIEQLAEVSPAQALNHPTWRMGRRITVDSATLMNKGFEVIEACWLFDFPPSQVEVVIHPQSSVHALVEYIDGSVLAQISVTDMRMPIQYALTWPERIETPVGRMDWTAPRSWEFFPPDESQFPLLKLAYEAQRAGGSATCTLNAADEIAVEAFLSEEISFPAIRAVVEETLNGASHRGAGSIAELLSIDEASRALAREAVGRRRRTQVMMPAASRSQ
jgi:1-deoxy-D-xylulose-5-phosphate reductoisomerase